MGGVPITQSLCNKVKKDVIIKILKILQKTKNQLESNKVYIRITNEV